VLRQLSPEVTSATLHVFTPGDVVRYRPSDIASIWRRQGGFGGASAVALVDYYLKSDAEKVTVDILDANGTTIRSFSNTAEEEKKRAEQPAAGGDEEEFGRAGPRVRVGLKKGMNRVLWDLRYEGARSFPGLIMWAASTRGPIAAPGRYQVRVTALGETKTAAFSVKRNPGVAGVTDADLHEQFRFAREISDKVTLANTTVMRIRSLKREITDRSDKARRPAVSTAAGALTKKLTDIEGEIYQHRNQSNQDPLNYPIRLNNKLAALQGGVESADSRPTDQSYTVFKELSSRLDAEIGKLEAVAKADLAAFNRQLAAAKLDPVKDEAPK